ncbi:MAG: hypothetical protein ACRD2L_07450, partial [Terriglobia bacterium]
MRFLLCLLLLLSCGWHGSALAETALQELLRAKTVYLRDRSGDRKLLGQIREQVKEWGRWEFSNSARDADLVLVLTVEAKTVEKIRLKSLEEPHAAPPDEEYEVRTLTARTRAGRDLASFSTRPGWTTARD